MYYVFLFLKILHLFRPAINLQWVFSCVIFRSVIMCLTANTIDWQYTVESTGALDLFQLSRLSGS